MNKIYPSFVSIFEEKTFNERQKCFLGTKTLTDVAREGIDSDEYIRAGTNTHKGAPSDQDDDVDGESYHILP